MPGQLPVYHRGLCRPARLARWIIGASLRVECHDRRSGRGGAPGGMVAHGKECRTLCVHGDNPEAVAFVRELRDSLERQGVRIQAFA